MKRFLVCHRKTGETLMFSVPEQVASFLWGKNIRDWLVYKQVPPTPDVLLTKAMLK